MKELHTLQSICTYFSISLLVIFFGTPCHLSGQYNDLDFRNMPTPNTASIIQSNFFEVNSYTGQANIGIPLHTIESKGMSMPISLSYDTKGVMVNAHPSWVGLNC